MTNSRRVRSPVGREAKQDGPGKAPPAKLRESGYGIQPTHIGALPPQLTGLMRTNVNVQELTVRALLDEGRQHVYHAAMLDPHTAAELDLDQIWALVDDLIDAHGSLLLGWIHARS